MRKLLCIILIVTGIFALYAVALAFNNLAASVYVFVLALLLALFLTRDPFAEVEPEERSTGTVSGSFDPPTPEKNMKITDHAHA